MRSVNQRSIGGIESHVVDLVGKDQKGALQNVRDEVIDKVLLLTSHSNETGIGQDNHVELVDVTLE